MNIFGEVPGAAKPSAAVAIAPHPKPYRKPNTVVECCEGDSDDYMAMGSYIIFLKALRRGTKDPQPH